MARLRGSFAYAAEIGAPALALIAGRRDPAVIWSRGAHLGIHPTLTRSIWPGF